MVQKRTPDAADRSMLRAAFETLADFLVGRNIDDLDTFVRAIRAALAGTIGLLIVVAGWQPFLSPARALDHPFRRAIR